MRPLEEVPDDAHGDIKPERSHSIPFDIPAWALNRLSISAFNSRYYRKEGGRRYPFLSDYDAYFYPLDALAIGTACTANAVSSSTSA